MKIVRNTKIKVTDENTNTLKENEIFVFGSNLAGIHGGGASLHAKNNFGAVTSVGEGLTGQCYALPTKDKNIETLPFYEIYKSVEVLLKVVKNSDKFFIITAVGCGLAGYSANDIAPMFEPFVHLPNVSLPQSFIDVIFPPKIIGFKVTDKDMKCRDIQFTMNKKHSVKGDIVVCNNGFHFCKELKDCFNYYAFTPENRVFLVEGQGDFDFDNNKVAVRDIKFIKELNWYQILDKINTGIGNSGLNNSGDYNSGNRNSGDYNSGDYNSGYYNSGYYNSGNYNSGNRNSGNRNSGNRNSGNRNSGDYNSGDYNSGNYNSGNRNSGDYNSGYYNSGDYNSGYYNSDEPTVRIFNKDSGVKFSKIILPCVEMPTTKWIAESDMTDEEKQNNPKFFVTKGYLKTIPYKEAFKIAWDNNRYFREATLVLPNFDAKIFEDITGIKI
jgi:hypothetical protein